MLQDFQHLTDPSEEPRDWKKGKDKAEKSRQWCKEIKSHFQRTDTNKWSG